MGAIYRSTDCGKNWVDMTPYGTDPPNDWSDDPAPEAGDVTYVQRADNIHKNGAHYFLANWQNDSDDWRSWLLSTPDDGVNWTWHSLYDVATGPNLVVNGDFDSSLTSWTNNVLSEWYQGECRQLHSGLTIANLEQSLVVQETGTHTLRGTFTRDASFDQGAFVYCRTAAWPAGANYGYNFWADPTGGTKSTTFSLTASDTVWIAVRSGAGGVDYNGMFDDIELYLSDSPDELRGVWMDTDSATGGSLYLTLWRDGTLQLYTLDTDSWSKTDTVSLGSCTAAELDAKSYWVAPNTVPFSSDLYVFGRMDSPAGLSGVHHVIKLSGGSWSAVETGFGSDYVSAFRSEGLSDPRSLYAIRASASDVPKFYTGSGDSLSYVSDLPLPSGSAVFVDAMSVKCEAGTPTDEIAVGCDTAHQFMILSSDNGGVDWDNATDGLSAQGSIRSVAWV